MEKNASISAKIAAVLSVIFVLFHVYTAMFGVLPGIGQKSVHLGLLMIIFYVREIAAKKILYKAACTLMLIFSTASTVYITVLDETLQARSGIVFTADIVMGILLIIAIFFACQRKMGNPLVIITGIFVLYAFFGKYVPGFLNQPGMTIKKFVNLLYLTTSGIWGTPLYASASYVVIFVLLGAVMGVSGIGDYFTTLATALFGKFRGGPAKVAVVASGLFGSISGSPTANVIGTGTFTIPLMKKNGFDNEYAGAVEATASTGGAIMPPIMGSTAFVMAEMLGVSYANVAAAAVIPAILYSMSILFSVDIYAAKHGLRGMTKEEVPDLKEMLKEIWKLAPLVFLILAMSVFGFTVARSGLYTVFVCLILVELNPKTRLSAKQWLEIAINTAKSATSVGVACAMAGIITGLIMGSGLRVRITSILTTVAGHSMLLLLVLTMIVSLIMGMGVPTTAAYLVLAALVAPTLVDLGLSPMAANMFIFYFGCISSVTPPVAMAAYAGAAIAGCDPNRCGYKAFRLAIAAFIIPYMFVYNPVLLMDGTAVEIITCIVTALMGAYLLGSGFEGFFWAWKVSAIERIVLLAGAVLLIVPGTITDLTGIAIIVIEFVLGKVLNRRAKFQEALAAEKAAKQ